MRTTGRILWSAMIVAILAGCTLPAAPSPSPSETTAPTKDQAMNTSCTQTGVYKLRQGIGFSEPELPAATSDPALRPRVGIIGIFTSPEPAAVTLAVTQHGPSPLPNFKELELGDTADFYGYSIKITSICSTEIRFDLVTVP